MTTPVLFEQGLLFALVRCKRCHVSYAMLLHPQQPGVVMLFEPDKLEDGPTHMVAGGVACERGHGDIQVLAHEAAPVEGGWLVLVR